MKKITFLFILGFILTNSYSQCLGTFEYINVVSAEDGSLQMMDGCNWSGDWNNISGLTIGNDYEFSSELATDYLTFTDDSNNVIAYGTSPLIITNMSVTSGRFHIYYDSTCVDDDICRDTFIQCTSCIPPATPENDDCSSVTATSLVNGDPAITFTGTTIGGTMSADEEIVFGTAVVWEAVTLTAECSNLTVDFCGTTAGIMDTYVWTQYSDCLTEITAASEFDFDMSCSDGNPTMTFANLPSGTYYIPVLADSNYNTLGDYTMNVSSADCPLAPECASNPTPINGAIDVPVGDNTFAWDAPTSGPEPTAYNLYAGETTSGDDYGLITTVTETTVDLNITGYNFTYYWKVVPVNGATEAEDCVVWSFTTEGLPDAGPCIFSALYPANPVVSLNDGTLQTISTCNFAGEYAYVTGLTIGEDYEFSSDAGDNITVTDTSNNILAYGYSPLLISDITLDEVYVHFSLTGNCDTEDACRATYLQCLSCTLPDAPVNDNACDAIPLAIGAPSSSGYYTNAYATTETNELGGSCYFFGDPASNSVWFSFYAPASGDVVISTVYPDGTLTDTQITLFDISNCSDLSTATELGCDEDDDADLDDNGISNLEAYLQYEGLTPGNLYYVAIDGYDDSVGTFDIGVFDLTTLSSSESILSSTALNYYPNPTNGIVNLNAPQIIDNITVKNMLGQEVLNLDANTSNYELNMSNLNSGTYFVQISMGDTVETIKVIKE